MSGVAAVKNLQEELKLKDQGNMGSPLSREQAIIIGTHQHYKGGIYQILMEVEHSETGEPMVLRKHLWPYEFSFKVVPKLVFDQDITTGLPRHRRITDVEKEAAEVQLKKKYT